MMLDHMNLPRAAERIRAAIRQVLSQPRPEPPIWGGRHDRIVGRPFASLAGDFVTPGQCRLRRSGSRVRQSQARSDCVVSSLHSARSSDNDH